MTSVFFQVTVFRPCGGPCRYEGRDCQHCPRFHRNKDAEVLIGERTILELPVLVE